MSTQKKTAEAFEREAAEIITQDILRLPPGVQSGTASRLVRLIVDAAVARMFEGVERERAARQEAATRMGAPAARATLGTRK